MILDLSGSGGRSPRPPRRWGPSAPSTYVSAIFAKLQVADRTQAILRARDAGLAHH